MYSLDQELAFATQKVREQRAVIATLQSELAAVKESRDREAVAYDKLNEAFLDLNLELAAAREELAGLVSLIKEYEFDAIPTGVRLWIERHESANKGEEG